MSPVSAYENSSFGNRTLPQTLDDLALATPERLYASVPKGHDLSDGFIDVSCKEMARCANFMASWIRVHLGSSRDYETMAYIGIPDLRSAAVFLGAVKCGYRVLLPSPRNQPAVNFSLMEQTQCTKLLYTAEVWPVIEGLRGVSTDILYSEIPSFNTMLESRPEPHPFTKSFEEAQDDPIVVLHSSGSTGLPKPITMTHASFAVLDRERFLPTVPGRKNRDYSIWNFNGGGRFYTVFPYFHLAGFLSLIINPIFTEASSPVLGPSLLPPSGSLLKEVMRHQYLRALYLPPSIAEQLLQEPDGLEFFRGLDFLCYTGGPFSRSAGERLSKVTELCPLYGSTEAFQVPQLAPSPQDWAWMEWNPHFKVDMQASSDEHGVFELVLFADENTKTMSALNHNMRGVTEYRTKDLFKPHPEKFGLWQYYGRKDDIIVLSNGEKFNPVPMELAIQAHPDLAGALTIGQGRSCAFLLIEPKADLSLEVRTGLVDAIWPRVEEANRLVPAQGRILRGKVLMSKPEKPFARAGKGTIIRKLTEQLYKPEIDELYVNDSAAALQELPQLQRTMIPHFEPGTILKFVRDIVTYSFPELSGIQDDDDLFSRGLDSVTIGQLLRSLKSGLKHSAPSEDFSWLDIRVVYHNSSILRLSNVLGHFLNKTELPKNHVSLSRVSNMEDLVRKYTGGLEKPSETSKEGNGTHAVALIGSTGYLGPHILASLLNRPGLGSIYCLNRSADARERTELALKNIGRLDTQRFQSIKFIISDLAAPKLGLNQTDLDELSVKVDSIIYNSWRPNFSLPLHSFEEPFLSGLRNIIDWARNMPVRPRIVFISSIAAVGNWSKVFPSQPRIPEIPITDTNVAMHMGYGESKCVGERVLQVAHESCGIPVNIIRIGQIGGPCTSGGEWPVQGWLLAIIRTSKALGALPTQVAPVDWIPVDILASQISDVVTLASAAVGYHIYNMVHPDAAPWKMFLDVLHHRFSVEAERMSLPEWLGRLETADQKKYVALRFSDFLRSMGDGHEDMLVSCGNIKEVSSMRIVPLTEDLLTNWLKGWKF